MVRQHHQLNGHEFEQTLGDSEGQRSLVCCSPWACKESDTTQWLNKNNSSQGHLWINFTLKNNKTTCSFSIISLHGLTIIGGPAEQEKPMEKMQITGCQRKTWSLVFSKDCSFPISFLLGLLPMVLYFEGDTVPTFVSPRTGSHSV